MSTSAHQTSHDLMCALLYKVLLDGVQAGPNTVDGIGSVQFRASATRYGLLLDHPIDRRGWRRSCRRPGAMFGLLRCCCRVHHKANLWLHHIPAVLPTVSGSLLGGGHD